MRVMFLTNLPSPYRVDFFNELGKKCDLTVVFERLSASNRNDEWKNKNKNINYKEVYLNGINIGEEASLSLGAVNIIRKNKFDVIIISGYSSPTTMLTILYLNLFKIPFIMSCDGGIISNDKKFKYKLKKFFISKASLWLSTGKNTSEYLIHYGANKDKIKIYPFTPVKRQDITNMKFNKKKIREELGIKEDKVIISVGQFIHRKGYDILLNACKMIDKSVGIYIIGGVPTKDYIDLKQNLKLENVHFIGFKSKEELKKYYESADLFVLPTREDIWGLVINEAMSFGLPIITTDKCVAGLELVLDGENGYIVPAEDSNAIAAKLNLILEDKNLSKSMSSKSIEIITDYTIENMSNVNYNIILDFYKKLL